MKTIISYSDNNNNNMISVQHTIGSVVPMENKMHCETFNANNPVFSHSFLFI